MVPLWSIFGIVVHLFLSPLKQTHAPQSLRPRGNQTHQVVDHMPRKLTCFLLLFLS
ncbi:hypothetical protein Hanom_Chr03g00178901 [Helianthus anomalus]